MMSKPATEFHRARLPESGSARTGFLAVVSFLLGVAATAAWFHLGEHPRAASLNPPPAAQPAASESTGPMPGASPAPEAFVEPTVTVSADAIAALKRALPDYSSMSLDDGIQALRQAALKQFTEAAQEMQSQVGKAEDQLAAAQNSQSASEQQAAMKHLQQVQSDEDARLKQIAGNLQTQIAALKQLKSGQP
jgi:hypothetical protein